MSEKPLKIFGTVGGSTREWYEQVPTNAELKHGTPEHPTVREFTVGETIESYTIKGTEADAWTILGQYSHDPVLGRKGVQVHYKQEEHPLDTISVNIFKIDLVPDEGTDLEETRDYGSDDGETDYDDWTMERHARNKKKTYKIVLEDAKEWPPFKIGKKILMKPSELWVSFAALQAGYRPGDMVSYGGSMHKVCHINGGHYSGVAYTEVYQRFISKIEILVLTESRSWKVSAKAAAKDHLYKKDGQHKIVNDNKIQYVQITVQGNRDGKLKQGQDEPESRTYTVIETITTKQPYYGQHIPHGFEKEERTTDD